MLNKERDETIESLQEVTDFLSAYGYKKVIFAKPSKKINGRLAISWILSVEKLKWKILSDLASCFYFLGSITDYK